MTTKLEQHRIDHIKLGLNGWIYGAGEAPLTESNNLLYLNYDTSDFGIINNQLYIKDTGIDHLNIQNVGTYIHTEIDNHIDNISNPHNVLANQVDLSFLSGATYTSVQSMNDIYHSTGWVSGGVISDAGGESINIASGSGYIRAIDNNLTTLVSFDWSGSSGISIPTNTTRFIGIEYNSGSPQVVVKTTDSWDYNTEFPIGTVVNINSHLHIEEAQHAIGDHASLMIQRLYGVQGIQRDKKVGGLVVSETGTRNLTLSAGQLWDKLNSYTISALDTSGTDTFETYYSDGAGGWTETTGLTQWPNTQYDSGSGTLATISANRYGVLWIFVETDGDLSILYGTAQYNTLAQAEASTIPSSIPDILIYHGFLVARLIFQESAGSAISIESSFSTFFSGSSVTDHGSLAGLTDDDHSIYALLTGRSGGQTLIGGTAAGDDLTLQSTSNATKGDILFGTSAYDEVNNRLGIGTNSPSALLHIQDSSNATIRIQDTTNNAYTLLSQGDVNFNINNTYNGNMTFSTNNTEYMRLTSGGSLGLGGEASPDSTLSVKGNVGIGSTYAGSSAAPTNGLIVEGDVGIGTDTILARLTAYDDAASTFVASFQNDGNNTNRLGIAISAGLDTPSVNGDCRWIDFYDGDGNGISTIGYNTSSPYAAFYSLSDARLKENIRDTKITALDKINALTLKSFDWKPDRNGKRKQSQDFSFIAQDIQKIIPECVAKNEEGYLSITEAPLIKYLVKSIQELNHIIESQQKQIDKLKT